jgi:hypothetical protein
VLLIILCRGWHTCVDGIIVASKQYEGSTLKYRVHGPALHIVLFALVNWVVGRSCESDSAMLLLAALDIGRITAHPTFSPTCYRCGHTLWYPIWGSVL